MSEDSIGEPNVGGFLWNLALLAGLSIATLCGLGTVVIGVWTLPKLVSPGPQVEYSFFFLVAFLVTSLMVGGLATFSGALLFRWARRRLPFHRPDGVDRLASGATLIAGVLYALAWSVVTIWWVVHGTLDNLRATWVVGAVGCLAATSGAWAARGGYRRLRAALSPAPGGP